MTIRETAEALGLKVRTIRAWITTGILKAEKRGKVWIIHEDVVFGKEIQERANKSREHSARIKRRKTVGML